MPNDKRWDALSPSDWNDFAAGWLAQLRGEPTDSNLAQSVVMMNFTATAEHQWQFVKAAISHAQTDEELGHIAAGPVEHILGKHGAEYIDRVEEMASSNPLFAKMMLGVWKYMMTDEVWERVQAIKAAQQPDGDPNAA